jgi:hypothetical protein
MKPSRTSKAVSSTLAPLVAIAMSQNDFGAGCASTISGAPPCILQFQSPKEVFQHHPCAFGTALLMQFFPGPFRLALTSEQK